MANLLFFTSHDSSRFRCFFSLFSLRPRSITPAWPLPCGNRMSLTAIFILGSFYRANSPFYFISVHPVQDSLPLTFTQHFPASPLYLTFTDWNKPSMVRRDEYKRIISLPSRTSWKEQLALPISGPSLLSFDFVCNSSRSDSPSFTRRTIEEKWSSSAAPRYHC